MTLVLDAGGVTALVRDRPRLQELRNRGHWPPQIPAVVLTEALTGDHRRDFHANRLLRTCQIRDVDERGARDAARLRTASGRARSISAVDATVAAFAARHDDAIVITSDPQDLSTLADCAAVRFRVVAL